MAFFVRPFGVHFMLLSFVAASVRNGLAANQRRKRKASLKSRVVDE